MPTVVLSPLAKQQFLDNSGRPLVGGKLFTYLAGTTTKQSTYVDSGGVTQNTNPVILNFRGECSLWLPPNVGYKFVLAPATDTDPPTNPIWTVDNLVASQLLTLYGGVDTGVANAYVISISLPQSAYTDGTFIIFIPSNTNTLASTINVNGLGPVAIVNTDGSALSPGELTANVAAQIVYKGGSWLLLNPTVANLGSSFSATAVDLVGTPSVTVTYARFGRLVILNVPVFSGTSNGVNNRLTGLPTNLQTGVGAAIVRVGGGDATDNGVATYAAQSATIAATSNQISFLFKGGNWTAAGTKSAGGIMIPYFTSTPY
jgi:hypothetical protein